MKIACVICSDLLTPSDDVYYTPCGHVFHFSCLTQWLQRSKSCPQCREKVTESKIHRIYFNYSDTYVPVESSSTLQERVDSLKFQIMLKEKDIQHYTSKTATLEHQTAGLRKEVRKLEAEILQKDSAIHALKTQTKYLKQQNEEAQAAKKEAGVLKRKLEELRSVQVILDAPAEDIDEIITNTRNPASLATYISVLKRELTSSSNKCKELRVTAKKLQQDLTKVSLERNFLSGEHSKRMQLEEDYAICESEKTALQQKCVRLEAANSRYSNNSSDSNSLSIESNTPPEETSHISLSPSVENKTSDDSVIFVSSSVSEPSRKIEIVENSQVKSVGVSALIAQQSQRYKSNGTTGLSILAKRSRITLPSNARVIRKEVSYDGFGGHSKPDNFPVSNNSTKQKKSNDSKSKRLKLDTGGNQAFIIN